MKQNNEILNSSNQMISITLIKTERNFNLTSKLKLYFQYLK